MKAFIAVLAAVFVAVALSQTPPNINDNFSGNVVLVEEWGTHKVKFDVSGYSLLVVF